MTTFPGLTLLPPRLRQNEVNTTRKETMKYLNHKGSATDYLHWKFAVFDWIKRSRDLNSQSSGRISHINISHNEERDWIIDFWKTSNKWSLDFWSSLQKLHIISCRWWWISQNGLFKTACLWVYAVLKVKDHPLGFHFLRPLALHHAARVIFHLFQVIQRRKPLDCMFYSWNSVCTCLYVLTEHKHYFRRFFCLMCYSH